MELLDRAKKIDDKVTESENCRKELPRLVTAAAIAAGKYAREFRVAVIRLRAEGTPATVCNKLAEGECEIALIEKLRTEGMLKITIEKLRAICNEMSGNQSVFSKLSHT